MKRLVIAGCWLALAAGVASAFPPAPYHTIHGLVRDERGRPLSTGEATIQLLGSDMKPIVSGPADQLVGPGENYRLRVPIDSAIDSRLYQVNSMRPALPFTIRVIRDGVTLLPIEMTGADWRMGDPARDTRIDLTLGVDSDGDGIPDAWELALIESDATGRLRTLEDVRPGDDSDGDGMTNLQEYLVGTYALDRLDVLELKVISRTDEHAELRFTAVPGHTYQLHSSVDGQTWMVEEFATEPGGATYRQWLADDVRIIHALVPDDPAGTRKLFRLHVD